MPGTRSLKRERAILVGLCPRKKDRLEVEEHLEELGELAETAGADVVASSIQDRGRIDPSTLIRRGRVSQLAVRAREKSASLVLFDDDLSPAQARNLEKALPTRVLDRSTLILDIFARRARSREAKTQVELARLRYMLPRLTRQWGHLSRQDGGIGLHPAFVVAEDEPVLEVGGHDTELRPQLEHVPSVAAEHTDGRGGTGYGQRPVLVREQPDER